MVTKWNFLCCMTAAFFVLLVLTFSPWFRPVMAQTPQGIQFNIARTLNINDKAAVDGDIMSISKTADTLTRSAVTSDQHMFGVLISNPLMVYRTLPTIPVAKDGEAIVNVTTLGGPIAVGDYVTSSPIAGKGQAAQGVAGYMVGAALEAFNGKGATQSVTYQGKKYQLGRIRVTIGIGPASPIITKAAGGFLGTMKQLATAILYNISTSQQTERLVRYILAVIIAVVIFYISYRTFGTNVTKGMEAIGRNPLAKGSIQAMLTLNIILLLISCLAGVALALVIISL